MAVHAKPGVARPLPPSIAIAASFRCPQLPVASVGDFFLILVDVFNFFLSGERTNLLVAATNFYRERGDGRYEAGYTQCVEVVVRRNPSETFTNLFREM